MSLSFFPKAAKFFELFKRQNALLVNSSEKLDQIFLDYNDIGEKGNIIVKDELAGNEIAREITRQLSITFITPIDREDIHGINFAQENVLNALRYISTRVGLYRFTQIKPGARELIHKLKLMIAETPAIIEKLHSRRDVQNQIQTILETKREADILLLVCMGEIFEDGHHPGQDLMELLKWSQVYDKIEEALANTEILANTLEGISLKNA